MTVDALNTRSWPVWPVGLLFASALVWAMRVGISMSIADSGARPLRTPIADAGMGGE